MRCNHQGSRMCLAGSSTRQAGGGADTAGRRRPAGLAVWRCRAGAQREHQRACLGTHRHPHTRAEGSKGEHQVHLRCTSGNAEDLLDERWPTACALLRSTLHRRPQYSWAYAVEHDSAALLQVLVRGRLHAVRGKGKSAFLVVRQGGAGATVQAVMFVDDTTVSKVRDHAVALAIPRCGLCLEVTALMFVRQV